MAGKPKSAIAQRMRDLLAGGQAKVLEATFAGPMTDLPWVCSLEFLDGARRTYQMYFWSVSQGGRGRPASEYRIQAKLKVERGLRFGQGTTLLLGYYRSTNDRLFSHHNLPTSTEMEIIVAWDPIQHMALGSSSSCQVPFGLLLEAHLDGIAETGRRCLDGGVERVIAFRSEFLASYVREGAGGHNAIDTVRLKSYFLSGGK